MLYKEICKLKSGSLNKKDEDRVINSVNRYLARMSTRCTPFGLFASCSLGNISTCTNIVLDNNYIRKTRLDMLYLCELISKMTPCISNLRYFPNLSLYKEKRYYRYIEYQQFNYKRQYSISLVKRNKYLDYLLSLADRGITLDDMIKNLEMYYHISSEEASIYVQELINVQLIVSELFPTITGGDLLHKILNQIKDKEAKNFRIDLLNNIYLNLQNLDNNKNNDISDYHKIIDNVKELDIPYDEKYLFQVDSYRKYINSTISDKIIEELKQCLSFLCKIIPKKTNKNLEDFKQAYNRRYENQTKSLIEVLDSELGIGYPVNTNIKNDPFIENFYIPKEEDQDSLLSSILYNKYFNNSSNDNLEITLLDEDVKDVNPDWEDLPSTIYCVFELYCNLSEHIIKIKSIGGSSGANLLTRFAYLDKSIYTFIKEITDTEQKISGDKILAEIVHLPESRVGNILHRPHLREYELVYLTPSDLSKERIINLNDILITIRNNRIILLSKEKRKEIIPYLTTAHNYHTNKVTPIYRFLCDLQLQNKRGGLVFDWGILKSKLDFFPRVKYKNIILSPAIWKINSNEIENLIKENPDDFKQKIDQWRVNKNIPNKVLVLDGDNEMLIDWNNIDSINSIFSIIKNKRYIFLSEFIFNTTNAVVYDIDGRVYTNEIITVFYKDKK